MLSQSHRPPSSLVGVLMRNLLKVVPSLLKTSFSQGQLGLGDTYNRYDQAKSIPNFIQSRNTPTLIPGGALSSLTMVKIAGGGYHSLFIGVHTCIEDSSSDPLLDIDGFVYSMGYNPSGQLMTADSPSRVTATQVGHAVSSISATSISAGRSGLLSYRHV